MTAQSLLSGWCEPAFINDKGWVLDWLTRLNPHLVKILGSIDAQTGAWRFEFPDQVQARLPQTEIIYRPYATNENDLWKLYTAKKLVSDFKAHLEGRRVRVTFCCEPAPSPQEFTAFMRYSVEFMEEAHKQDLLVDMWGIPAQHLQMYTNDPRSIDRGGWDTALRVAGDLRGTVLVNIHCYTGLYAPAGTYDDSYLREIATKSDLLRDEKTWATYADIESRPFQTRHLFRDMWLNRRALKIGALEHDFNIGESIFDYFGDEHDLQETWRRAGVIAGGDLDVCLPDKRYVGGIRTLPNFTRWKQPHLTFQQSIIKQLKWHGDLRAKNPRCKGWALYMLSDKDGDQRPHNWLAYKDILDACVGLNPMAVTTPPPPPPPVVVDPPVLFLATPAVDAVNVRATSPNGMIIDVVVTGDIVKVIAPTNANALIGVNNQWVQVITAKGTTGWCAAWLLKLVAPPQTPTLEQRVTALELWRASLEGD